ncbi:MAG TPA: hypothetical protein VGT82_05595, partial [Ktedonobacteraceae bacterium]|nr:hypothetical protein [Ktedonobacteraceae bacterium]
DARDNVAMGNYPQAFTHIALINSAINLQKAERRLSEHYADATAITVRLTGILSDTLEVEHEDSPYRKTGSL